MNKLCMRCKYFKEGLRSNSRTLCTSTGEVLEDDDIPFKECGFFIKNLKN